MSLAARKSGATMPGRGASSTMSKPRMVQDWATFFSRDKTSFQNRPPGSGVPVAGMSEGSRTSRSIVTKTSPFKFLLIFSYPSLFL